MTKSIVLGLIGLCFSTPAFSQLDISGTWAGHCRRGSETARVIFELRADQGTLKTPRLRNPGWISRPMLNIRKDVSARTLTFSYTALTAPDEVYEFSGSWSADFRLLDGNISPDIGLPGDCTLNLER
jgi:hypothetical protein